MYKHWSKLDILTKLKCTYETLEGVSKHLEADKALTDLFDVWYSEYTTNSFYRKCGYYDISPDDIHLVFLFAFYALEFQDCGYLEVIQEGKTFYFVFEPSGLYRLELKFDDQRSDLLKRVNGLTTLLTILDDDFLGTSGAYSFSDIDDGVPYDYPF